MGGTASACTDRRCCGGGGMGAAEMYGGKTIWTIYGISRLPAGAACLHVTKSGLEQYCPPAVQEMMTKEGRAEVFRSFCGRVFNVGVGPTPDFEQALVAFAPAFRRTEIDIFLTASLDSKEDREATRWFIFVDRLENSTYMPEKSLYVRPPKKKGPVRKLLAGSSCSQSLELTPAIHIPPTYPHSVVDFSGNWREMAIEGDMETFLMDQGWNPLMRRILAGINYNIGKNSQVIEHVGDRVIITMVSPGKARTNELTVGAGIQKVKSLNGRFVEVDPYWTDEGNSMFTLQWEFPSEPPTMVKRYYRVPGKVMIQELTTARGCTVMKILELAEEETDNKTHA